MWTDVFEYELEVELILVILYTFMLKEQYLEKKKELYSLLLIFIVILQVLWFNITIDCSFCFPFNSVN